MYPLILHGRRRLFELQKWRQLRFSANPLQKASAFLSSSFSSGAKDGRKEQTFTVSYLVESLGLTAKLAESISSRVSLEEKGNPDSVLRLLKSHGFTGPQISTIITGYPKLLIADAEKTLGSKLRFLQSRGASTSELTEILSEVPKLLAIKRDKAFGVYYDFVKHVIEADKSCVKLSYSLPEGSTQCNKIRNVSALRELGVPQKLLFSLVVSDYYVYGKERFEDSLKMVVEKGFDPKNSKFVKALCVIQRLSDKAIEEKLKLFKSLGFDVDEVWELFKKDPMFLVHSEKNVLNSFETFLGLGFDRDEVVMMVKRSPSCIGFSVETVKKKIEFLVNKMNWPLKAVALQPQVLNFSFEKRLVPRCNVIKALMSKGLLGSEPPPMRSVLWDVDEVFLKRYVRKHDDKLLLVRELMAIFKAS